MERSEFDSLREMTPGIVAVDVSKRFFRMIEEAGSLAFAQRVIQGESDAEVSVNYAALAVWNKKEPRPLVSPVSKLHGLQLVEGSIGNNQLAEYQTQVRHMLVPVDPIFPGSIFEMEIDALVRTERRNVFPLAGIVFSHNSDDVSSAHIKLCSDRRIDTDQAMLVLKTALLRTDSPS